MDRIAYWHFRLPDNPATVVRKHSPLRQFPLGFAPFGGSHWWCLTRQCTTYLYEFTKQNSDYVNFFQYVFIPEEIFAGQQAHLGGKTVMERKNLVICRAGDQSLHQGWLSPAKYKDFDFAISYYGDRPRLYADESCLYEQSKGPKYPNIYNFIINNIGHILQYEAILIADDDLQTDAKTISEMFRLFHETGLWLAQPALTKDSYYSHPITLQHEEWLLHFTNFVEVMAPIFSKQVLLQCLFTFNLSASGWGLDYIWPKLLGNPTDKIAVLDAVAIRHTRPVGSGPVYKMFTIPPQQEMRSLCKLFHVPLPYHMQIYTTIAGNRGNAGKQKPTTLGLPKVSVIMPVYNGQQYLREAIESILAQTFTDFEFIILDDGSTDDSLKIIKSYQDTRIVLIRNEANLGLTATLNKGINAAKGKYIARMDADDISLPERLARQIEYMDSHPNIVVCGSWVETFGECAQTVWSYPIDPGIAKCCLLFRNIIAHPSVIIRKGVLLAEDYWYSKLYPHAEDYALWVKIAEKYAVANLPQVLLRYRISQGHVTSKFRQQQLATTAKIQLEQINTLGLEPTEQEYLLHQSLGLSNFPKSDAFFEAVLQWFIKLKQANLACRYYPEPAFSQVLRLYLATVCQATGAAGCEKALQHL